MKALVIALALTASPAAARTLDQRIHDLPKAEWIYQGVAFADFASTEICLHRNTCEERNPMFGKHPSAGRLFLGSVVIGGIGHAAFTSIMQDHAPKLVKPFEIISIGLRGGVVAANLRFAF